MSNNTQTLSDLFNESFYIPVYKRWRVDKEKAGKDIVGEEYEKFRKNYYTQKGLKALKGKRVFGDMNPDLVVYKGEEIVIVEECKGHYVDKCFLERAIGDAVKIFRWCLENNKSIPYFVLSCATNLKTFKPIFNHIVDNYRKDLADILKEKFVYLPLCDHGRLPKNSYFTNPDNNFKIDQTLVDKQEEIITSITE
jgi:hypothetical protein